MEDPNIEGYTAIRRSGSRFAHFSNKKRLPDLHKNNPYNLYQKLLFNYTDRAEL